MQKYYLNVAKLRRGSGLSCDIADGTIDLRIEINAIDINDHITHDEVMIYDNGVIRYPS